MWDCFLTNFGERPEFFNHGERAERPFLEGILVAVLGQLFPQGAVLEDLRAIRLAEHQFVHGGCMVNGHLTTFFYFEDIHAGMLAVVMSASPPDTKMIRFRGRALPRPSTEPSVN